MNWDYSSLQSLCQIRKGEQLNKLELESSGDFPCINGGILPSGFTHKWNRLENTITISEGGNSCGFVNFLLTKFWSGGHCYTIHDLSDTLDLDFLYYALKGRESEIMRLRVGSGLPNIQQTAIRNFSISFPKRIGTQKRIAEILSIIDASIEETQALIDKYGRVKRGFMQDLLTCGIDTNGNIRSKQSHEFIIKNGIEVPAEWDVSSLQQLTEHDSTICYGIVQVRAHTENGVPTVAIKDMGKNYESLHLTDPEIERMYKRSRIRGGDLLISVKGTTGRIDLVPSYLVGNISRDVAKVRLKSGLEPKFFAFYFESIMGQRNLDSITVGTTRKEISIQPLKELYVPCPSPSEQERIIHYISGIITSIQNQNVNLLKLKSLRTGLMQALLSGRKPVQIVETAVL